MGCSPKKGSSGWCNGGAEGYDADREPLRNKFFLKKIRNVDVDCRAKERDMCAKGMRLEN